MPKLTNKAQKIFCGDVSPNNVVAVFGSNKAGSPAYSNDPDTIQSLGAWINGWASAVGTNSAPSIQDMNSFFYVATRQLAYLFQGGIGEWNANITYYTGSIVNDGSGVLYKSLVDNNLNNAVTDGTKWQNYKSNDSKQVSGDIFILQNTDYSFTWPSGATGPDPDVNIGASGGSTGPNCVGRNLVLSRMNIDPGFGSSYLLDGSSIYVETGFSV